MEVLEEMLLLSYWKVVEGECSEMGRQVVAPGMDGCGLLIWTPNVTVKPSRMALDLSADVCL